MGTVARQRTGDRLWWIVVSVVAAGGLLLGWLGVAVWNRPEDGTDGAAMLAMSCFFLSLAFLATAFICAVALILVRRSSTQHPNNAAPPAWYPDPCGAASRRWWDGHAWTGWTG
jgi:hypothetical protein